MDKLMNFYKALVHYGTRTYMEDFEGAADMPFVTISKWSYNHSKFLTVMVDGEVKKIEYVGRK